MRSKAKLVSDPPSFEPVRPRENGFLTGVYANQAGVYFFSSYGGWTTKKLSFKSMDLKKRFADMNISLFQGRLSRKQEENRGELHPREAFGVFEAITASILGIASPQLSAAFVAAVQIAKQFVPKVSEADGVLADADVHKITDINFSSVDPRDPKAVELMQIALDKGELNPFTLSFQNKKLSVGSEIRMGVVFNVSSSIFTSNFMEKSTSLGMVEFDYRMPNQDHKRSYRIDISDISETLE